MSTQLASTRTSLSSVPDQIYDLFFKFYFNSGKREDRVKEGASLALVCRAWRIPVQRELFQEVEPRLLAKTIPLFIDVLQSNFSALHLLVRKLKLELWISPEGSELANTLKLLNLLPSLSNLITLTLTARKGWERVDFTAFGAFPSVRTLVVERTDTPQEILHQFTLITPNITSLQITECSPFIPDIERPPPLSAATATIISPITFKFLKHLTLDRLDTYVDLCRFNILSEVTLGQIDRLDILKRSGYEPLRLQDIELLGTSLGSARDSIQHLGLVFRGSPETLSLLLDAFPTLVTLTMTGARVPQRTPPTLMRLTLRELYVAELQSVISQARELIGVAGALESVQELQLELKGVEHLSDINLPGWWQYEVQGFTKSKIGLTLNGKLMALLSSIRFGDTDKILLTQE